METDFEAMTRSNYTFRLSFSIRRILAPDVTLTHLEAGAQRGPPISFSSDPMHDAVPYIPTRPWTSSTRYRPSQPAGRRSGGQHHAVQVLHGCADWSFSRTQAFGLLRCQLASDNHGIRLVLWYLPYSVSRRAVIFSIYEDDWAKLDVSKVQDIEGVQHHDVTLGRPIAEYRALLNAWVKVREEGRKVKCWPTKPRDEVRAGARKRRVGEASAEQSEERLTLASLGTAAGCCIRVTQWPKAENSTSVCRLVVGCDAWKEAQTKAVASTSASASAIPPTSRVSIRGDQHCRWRMLGWDYVQNMHVLQRNAPGGGPVLGI